MAAMVALLLLAVVAAAIAGAHARRRLSHSSFSKTANAVAGWTPCGGLNPWELSKLEDSDILTPTDPDTYFPDRIWGNRTVPIIIETTHFTSEEVDKIRDVMKIINRLACVKLREANHFASDYLRITGEKAGCYSEVWGRKGGMQVVNLQPPACVQTSTVFHELLHVLGLRHVHNLPYRDDFIRVVEANIAPEDRKHFATYARNKNDTEAGYRYDYDSIMHFSRKAHSMNGSDTIETHDEGAVIGRRQSPSELDWEKLKLIYDC